MVGLPIHLELAGKNDMGYYVTLVILKFMHFGMVKLSSLACMFSYIILYSVNTYLLLTVFTIYTIALLNSFLLSN